MALLFSQETGNCCKTPILVRLMKLGGADVVQIQDITKFLKVKLRLSCQMDVRGVVVLRAPKLVRVLDCSMSCLYCLLCERNLAMRNGVQISFGFVLQNLDGHGNLRFVSPLL
jgi:uncharacterized 2Fe-2S/4Fe-4S cluster protein (DUF4445 family)